MAIARDLNHVLSKAKADEHFRTLILVDEYTKGPSVYCHFSHRFDSSSQGFIKEYFQQTYNQLQTSPDQRVFNVGDLPILNSIGRWKITIITKVTQDHYKIKDGEANSFDYYEGIER